MTEAAKTAPHDNWQPLVICPNRAIAARLDETLKEILAPPVVFVSEYPRLGAVASVAEEKRANVCFLDVITNSEHAQALLSELTATIPVIALLARSDGDLILRCLRRGSRDFLTDFSPDYVAAALDRLGKSNNPAPRPGGKVLCVAPGKPGSGASTLAVHLAVQAKGLGNVLLVDTDSLGASVAFQLKLKSDFHLGSVLSDFKRMDQDLWTRLVVSASGVDVLTAPEDPLQRFAAIRPPTADLCRFWREQYAIVVIDTADVYAAADFGFAAAADDVLVVTTNELPALHATRRAVQCLEAAAPDRARLRLILNRYTPSTGLNCDDVRTALAMDPFATLANDYETLQAALLEGRPVAATSRFGAAVNALWRQLQEKPQPARKSPSWLASILGRRSAAPR